MADTYLSSRLGELKVYEASQLAFLVNMRPPVDDFAPVYIDDAIRVKNWYSDLIESLSKIKVDDQNLPQLVTAEEDYENLLELAEFVSVEVVLLEKFSQAISPCRARHGLDTQLDYALSYIDGTSFQTVLAKAKRNFDHIVTASKDDFPPLAEAAKLLEELELIELLGHNEH